MQSRTSRRTFAALGLSAAAATRVNGSSDRIRIGIIGAGARGQGHLHDFSRLPDTEVVALCDIFLTKAERACAKQNVSPAITQDHRRVLDRKDIDAVIIATPDHSHVPLLLDALDGGKDVYVEKPMTFRMEDGARVVNKVQQTGRMVQVGTQQRSGRRILEAKERFIDSGMIGKISLVRTWLGWATPATASPCRRTSPTTPRCSIGIDSSTALPDAPSTPTATSPGTTSRITPRASPAA